MQLYALPLTDLYRHTHGMAVLHSICQADSYLLAVCIKSALSQHFNVKCTLLSGFYTVPLTAI